LGKFERLKRDRLPKFFELGFELGFELSFGLSFELSFGLGFEFDPGER
jgi:hypothetical protein